MDERKIAAIFRRALRTGKPEDAGARSGTIACIDTLSYPTDVPPGMTHREAGFKAVISCVSDMAAKGVRPETGLVSVCVPAGCGESEARQAAAGIAAACKRYGIRIIAGDTGQGERSITVCLLGRAGSIIPRGGANAGDLVFATGTFGGAAAGLESMLAGRAAFSRYVRRPEARLEFGVKNAKNMTASMDSSDGLASTLYGIAGLSKKRITISHVPVSRGVKRYAESHGTSWERLAFFGGEEYEIVFSAPPGRRQAVFGAAKRTGTPVSEIGAVSAGSGVFYSGGRLADSGWVHGQAPGSG